ncbi:hypothetical protein Fmac_030586 [Flemingia macrophylla]|uniref:pectinesterase n=1 Tax=Flemingia macrophylla TaxID=520843 RepID=A0ABD1KZK9_9FABA
MQKRDKYREGERSQSTILSFSDHYSVNQGTANSGTFISSPPNVIVSDITFKNCSINAIGRNINLPGFVTAQSRNSWNDPSGFVFEGGSLTGNGSVNLGRPWRSYSRVIFHNTNFSSVVTPHGWNVGHYLGQE